ncbi:MAG: radical SAM protein [Anaerolineae bacterium]|nr:radical SAM protein [Anaerolineae bacterium]
MEQQLFEQFFRAAPPEIDVEAVWREWRALRSPYDINSRHLPLPVWARRSFTESGEQAWSILADDLEQFDPNKAFCIYIHIPFCARRCSFCDCYSFPLNRHRERHIKDYVGLLDQEMRLWGALGTLAQRPVSTVHFGGGTPPFLGADAFSRVVQSCQQCFQAGSHTEWALESTSSELTDEIVDTLDSLGFTRLHIGVQTLEDPVREHINRQEPAAVVLNKISRAVNRGWIVSVDMIVGLPGQTLGGLLSDLKTLAGAGVDGFSLYELQVSHRNRRFAEQYHLDDQPRLINYFFMQAASRYLMALGYRKTLFNHYARERDTNLYFTFPERGEDCLALGTIADGMFGDYHYRHPTYAAYCRGVTGVFPGLQGGLRRNALENRLQPLTTALMAGRVSSKLLIDSVGPILARRWRELALLAEAPHADDLHLTGSGSWFVGNMISQLVEQAPPG